MRVVSVIEDGLLQATNALLEMTVGEYLNIGLRILHKNQYQRKRVSRSSSVYSLLNDDMKKLCSIPTIVLAFTNDAQRICLREGMVEEELSGLLNNDNLIILDGLQRTYTMRDVDSDLLFPDEEKRRFREHKIRIEVYCGLSKTGVLYRMLTLNTGQTPMSKRHEIEILYSSYLEKNIDGISFNRQIDPNVQRGIDVYDFDDAIEGFNAFLDADEAPIDRLDLLSVVRRLEKVVNNDYQRDLFEQFVRLYNSFVHIIDEKTNHWSLRDAQREQLKSLYGKDIPSIFNKSQTMSAFGAAVGNLLWNSDERGFGNLSNQFRELSFTDDANDTLFNLLTILQEIRENAKKIGVAQRFYLRLFFEDLLDPQSETYLNFTHSINKAKDKYDAKTIQPREKSLFD